MTTELVTVDFRRPYPVFPMADCVLMPQSVLPLHIFEPRYREMLSATIDSAGMLAMALFDGVVTQEDYQAGAPPLRPVVCLGQVRDYQRLEDGRYIVLLQGLCRARILSELAHEPYRMVHVAPIDEIATDEGSLRDYRQRIEALMRTQLLNSPNDGVRIDAVIGKDVSTAVMVDLAIATVCGDANQRYTMLAQRDVRRRAKWVVDRMQDIVGQRLDEHSDN